MEGFNKDWISRGTRRYADFTNVPPGKYVFRVKGSNNDGLWNEKGISLKIVITPPFWQKWWFLSLLVLFFSGLSYGIITISRKYLTLITFWKKRNLIGRYKLEEQIGSGGMGTIYQGTDITDTSTIVAIKVIREEFSKDIKLRKRFMNEAVIVDQIDHPNIVKIIERGEFNNRLFIAMELLNGPLLSEIIQTGNLITLRRILDITIQLLDAIHAIHLKGIIHRDLKPENIMLVKKGDNLNHVKLMDFGLARIQSITRITDSGMVMGTLTYLAPEQIATGEFSFASDVYSLGVILYEMLTLKKPFVGETTIDVMKQILEREPIQPLTFRQEISPRLNDIIMKMMAKNPDERPTSASILTAFKIFLTDL
jgi:serine/threonine-protein kinase